ncbi:MAG: beta-propeller fold lactonase family protein [Phycisphaerae bacterium]|nr:beta-propeller fold lactonase family protein [Gemmatimonadaceae bacterium]
MKSIAQTTGPRKLALATRTPAMGPNFANRVAAVCLLASAMASGLVAQTRSATTGAAAPPAATKTPLPPTQNYWAYVGAESADRIYRIKFGPAGTSVEKTIDIGELSAEMEGPHGLQISRDGKYLYMTTGHGTPDGKYWRYALGPDTLTGPGILLGNFPASIDVTPDGDYTFSANFNLHGDMVPSTVSVVHTPTNTEIARIVTCTMPHGSRISADGRRQYSTCMMDDQLVEIDAVNFAVARRFGLAKGKEAPVKQMATTMAGMDHSHMAGMSAGAKPTVDPAQVGAGGVKHEMEANSCSPTWALPSHDNKHVFVACNKSDDIIQIDVKTWKLLRHIKTGRGVYNLAITPDSKLLVATLKQGSAVEIFDIVTGRSLVQIPTSNNIAHGVTISSDSRFAFVSSEGKGAMPGKVDVIDLVALAKVGTADVGPQASGITFWKSEPARN